MTVLFILSLTLGAAAIPLKRAYDEQRFHSAVRGVIERLALAQNLMLIADTDVTVFVEYSEKHKQLEVSLEADKPLERRWAKIAGEKQGFPSIGSFKFEQSNQKKLELHYALGNMSQGTLQLFPPDGLSLAVQEGYKIYLPGYPAPCPFSGKQDEDFLKKSELLYPASLKK